MQLNNAFQEFNGPFIVTGRGPSMPRICPRCLFMIKHLKNLIWATQVRQVGCCLR